MRFASILMTCLNQSVSSCLVMKVEVSLKLYVRRIVWMKISNVVQIMVNVCLMTRITRIVAFVIHHIQVIKE